MPRFYFHLLNDTDVPDEEGTDLANFEAALAYAFRQARGMIGEMVKTEARIVLSHRIKIEDERGVVLDTIYFRDVVSIED